MNGDELSDPLGCGRAGVYRSAHSGNLAGDLDRHKTCIRAFAPDEADVGGLQGRVGRFNGAHEPAGLNQS
jgi:hypothetical protein